jgi:hypothetical protein
VKHYEVSEWTDYVRELANETDRAAMQQHLETDCRACTSTVNVLRKVVTAAAIDARLEVPEFLVHNARALFALQRPEKVTLSTLIAKLVFDSFREPLAAGIRSQQRITRQALYETGAYSVDLRLEHERGSSNVILVGQVASRANEENSIANVPVLLMTGSRVISRAKSNEFGEFQMNYKPCTHPRLHLAMDNEWIEVRLAELQDEKLSN